MVDTRVIELYVTEIPLSVEQHVKFFFLCTLFYPCIILCMYACFMYVHYVINFLGKALLAQARHIIIKMSNIKEKERILKEAKEKQLVT